MIPVHQAAVDGLQRLNRLALVVYHQRVLAPLRDPFVLRVVASERASEADWYQIFGDTLSAAKARRRSNPSPQTPGRGENQKEGGTHPELEAGAKLLASAHHVRVGVSLFAVRDDDALKVLRVIVRRVRALKQSRRSLLRLRRRRSAGPAFDARALGALERTRDMAESSDTISGTLEMDGIGASGALRALVSRFCSSAPPKELMRSCMEFCTRRSVLRRMAASDSTRSAKLSSLSAFKPIHAVWGPTCV
eukprot:scaffold1023_cov313-Pinguiococcus_pyrenoidosus.AAC.14